MPGRKKRLRDCPLCQKPLMRFFLSLEETIRMCPGTDCAYPFNEPTTHLARLITPIDFSMDRVVLGPEQRAGGLSIDLVMVPERKRGQHLEATPADLRLGLQPLNKKRRPVTRPPKGDVCTVENVRAQVITHRPATYTVAVSLPFLQVAPEQHH